MGLSVFGINLPDIKLPKIDIGSIGKDVLTKGVAMLKTVAKDMFTPAKDGKNIFKEELNYKVGPFDIKLKNPVDVLADKLLGMASSKLKDLGFDPAVIAKALGGTRDVKDVGQIDLPALPERTKEYAPKTTKKTTTKEVGGGTTKATSTAPKAVGGSTTTTSTSKAVTSAGTDLGAAAVEKFGGSLDKLESEITTALGKGGELNQTEMLQLQQKIQKRNELFQMLSQIMNLEHETKRNIIGNIR